MFGICLKGSLNCCVQIFSVTARIIQKDAEEKKLSFNPRPYFRLFINWLSELISSDFHHDGANFQVHMLNWHVHVLILYMLEQFHISKTFWTTYLVSDTCLPGFEYVCKCTSYSATLESSCLEVCILFWSLLAISWNLWLPTCFDVQYFPFCWTNSLHVSLALIFSNA
jgi:hypothetical protein